MTAIVKWNTPTPYVGDIDLFRTPQSLDGVKPDQALVTLPNGTLEFDDTTVDVSVPNYYTIGVNTDRGYVLSNSAPLSKFSNRGPGPATLIWGDERLGYFGTCTMGVDFPTAAEFGNNSTVERLAPIVHKFIRNNRIIYIPERAWFAGRTTLQYHINNSTGATLNANNSAVINTINSKNYVSSRLQWNFNNNYPTVTNTTEWQGYKFNVRAPRSMPDDWDGRYNDFLVNENTELNIVRCMLYGTDGGFTYMPAVKLQSTSPIIQAPFITAERNVLVPVAGVYSSSRIALVRNGTVTLEDPAKQTLNSEGESGVSMVNTSFQLHPIIDLVEY